MNEPPRGDGRWTTCFRCALAGIWHTVRTQRNARIHLAVTAGVVLLGLWLGLGWSEWAILVLTIAVVFMAEMFNTALEASIDLMCPGYHPLAKVGKDVAAGAVLVGSILAVIIGFLVIGPPLWEKLLRP